MKKCSKLNKVVVAFLCLTIFFSSALPAFAEATSVKSAATQIILPNGKTISIPVSLYQDDGNYLVMMNDGIASQVIHIYYFGSNTPTLGEADVNATHYYSEDITPSATNIAPSYYYQETKFYDAFDPNLFFGEYWFSTFDFYDSDGTLLIDGSDVVYDDGSSGEDDNPNDEVIDPGTDIVIKPSKSYNGLLPSISTDMQGYTDNWLILREHHYSVYPSDFYDTGILYEISDDTVYRYSLYFLSDDYSASIVSRNVGNSVTAHYIPQIEITAGTITRYDLHGTGISADYSWAVDWSSFTTATDKVWASPSDVTSVYPGFDYASFTGAMISNSDLWADYLSDTYIASSFSISLPATSGWSYAKHYYYPYSSNFDEQYGVVSFASPSVGFGVNLYDGFSGDVPEEEQSSIVEWLKRIYYAVVDGFQQVIDKLTGGDNQEQPGINTEDDDGFSLMKALKVVFDAILSVFKSIFGFLGDILGSIAGLIGDFFDLISDTGSEIYDFFSPNNDDSDNTDINDFFGFMRGLWDTLPSPVTGLIVFSFAMFLFLTVFKMVH